MPPDRRHQRRSRVLTQAPALLDLGLQRRAAIHDVAPAGVGLLSMSPLPISSPAPLILMLPDKTTIEMRGAIVWTDHVARAGVHFLDVPPQFPRWAEAWLEPEAARQDVASSTMETGGRDVACYVSPQHLTNALQDQDDASAAVVVEQRVRRFVSKTYGQVDESGLLLGSASSEFGEIARELERSPRHAEICADVACEALLHLIACEGVAIALRVGACFICIASRGLAPAVGVPLEAHTGLSGLCIRTGTVIRCDDTLNDARPEVAACQAVGIRSLVAMPVYQQDAVIGLVEAVSVRARAFDACALLAARRVAELVTRIAPHYFLPVEAGRPRAATAGPEALSSDSTAGAPSGRDRLLRYLAGLKRSLR